MLHWILLLRATLLLPLQGTSENKSTTSCSAARLAFCERAACSTVLHLQCCNCTTVLQCCHSATVLYCSPTVLLKYCATAWSTVLQCFHSATVLLALLFSCSPTVLLPALLCWCYSATASVCRYYNISVATVLRRFWCMADCPWLLNNSARSPKVKLLHNSKNLIGRESLRGTEWRKAVVKGWQCNDSVDWATVGNSISRNLLSPHLSLLLQWKRLPLQHNVKD